MNDLLNITIADGKYTVIQSHDGRLRALRYGNEWRDCVGDGLILALAQEVEKLTTECMDYHRACISLDKHTLFMGVDNCERIKSVAVMLTKAREEVALLSTLLKQRDSENAETIEAAVKLETERNCLKREMEALHEQLRVAREDKIDLRDRFLKLIKESAQERGLSAQYSEELTALREVWGDCIVALETLRNSDAESPISEISPELRAQIEVAVKASRSYAAMREEAS